MLQKILRAIRRFLYPNRGILGVFAVWAGLAMLMLFLNPMFGFVLEDPYTLAADVAFNLVIMYLLSCLSVWVYEKMRKK